MTATFLLPVFGAMVAVFLYGAWIVDPDRPLRLISSDGILLQGLPRPIPWHAISSAMEMTVAKTQILYLNVRRDADPELFDLFVRRNFWMSRKVSIPLAYFEGVGPQEVRSIVEGYLGYPIGPSLKQSDG